MHGRCIIHNVASRCTCIFTREFKVSLCRALRRLGGLHGELLDVVEELLGHILRGGLPPTAGATAALGVAPAGGGGRVLGGRARRAVDRGDGRRGRRPLRLGLKKLEIKDTVRTYKKLFDEDKRICRAVVHGTNNIKESTESKKAFFGLMILLC